MATVRFGFTLTHKHKQSLTILLLGLFALAALGIVLFSSKSETTNLPSRTNRTAAAQTYRLNVPKLGVNAPMINNVSGADEAIYLQAIEKGVAHFAGTPLPGEGGNTVIFGHSAYFKNKPGAYKEVFKSLDQLKAGDTVAISRGRLFWRYKVTESKIVEPDDLSVIQAAGQPTLTLITCWPPGTIEKRYVVRAVQVVPQPVTP